MVPVHHNALHPVEIKAAGLTIRGFSISGLATWIIVPELDVMFDAGECPLDAVPVNHVLLSHVHGDHSRCLPRHWQLRDMMGMKPARYVLPNMAAVDGFGKMIRAEVEMSGEDVADIQYPNFLLLNEGEQHILRKGLWVRTFSVDHRVDSQGFTVGRTVQKLKPEFEGLPGAQIGVLRQNGTVVSDAVDTALVTFIGDCTGASLAANTHIFNSKVVIIECTHVDDDQRERTAKYGHTHLRDIQEVLESVDSDECECVILKHFSMKESPEHIRKRVAELIPAKWASRVKVFLPPA